jgi:hypothetical protein
VTTAHSTVPVALRKQQAPVGWVGVHDVALHTLPLPLYVPLRARHCASVRITQAEVTVPGSRTQHAPVAGGGGGGQVALVQGEPTPWKVPFRATHCASVSWTHTGIAARGLCTQQAPVAGGGGAQPAVLQLVPAPRNVPFRAVHWASVT